MLPSLAMRIRPFMGLLPNREHASRVASLPYDVVNREEALALAATNSLSMLHVVRAEIDFPDCDDPYSDAVYEKALENFQKLRDENVLVRDPKACFYLYEQEMKGHRQCGLVALCHIDDYENNRIRKHEKTRPDKENDRTRLIGILNAHPGPVFLTYREQPEVMALSQSKRKEKPHFDFVSDDGIRHRFWRIEETNRWEEIFLSIPDFYIADGHHRAASAYRVGHERRVLNPGHDGTEDYNWFLTVLFSASELKILPYNRLIKDLNGLDSLQFLAQLEKVGKLSESEEGSPGQPGEVGVYLDKQWHRLVLPDSTPDDPVGALDISRVQECIFDPILDIKDQRTSPRIDFVGGIKGIRGLEEAVNSGKAAVAFSFYPVTLDQLMEISDAGQIMPPKSTWFEPKLRSGLVISTF